MVLHQMPCVNETKHDSPKSNRMEWEVKWSITRMGTTYFRILSKYSSIQMYALIMIDHLPFCEILKQQKNIFIPYFQEYSLHIYICVFLWLVFDSISLFHWISCLIFFFFSIVWNHVSPEFPYKRVYTFFFVSWNFPNSLPLIRTLNKRTSFTSDTFII